MDDWREEIKAELCYLMFTWNGMECTPKRLRGEILGYVRGSTKQHTIQSHE